MNSSITIHIPLPPKAVEPNARPSWRTKAKAKKTQRDIAFVLAVNAMYELQKPPRWKRATIKAVFYKPGNKNKASDPDNAIASLKASVDGLADAGVIDSDRELVWLPPEQRIGKAAEGVAGVELTVTPVIEVMTDAKPLEAT